MLPKNVITQSITTINEPESIGIEATIFKDDFGFKKAKRIMEIPHKI